MRRSVPVVMVTVVMDPHFVVMPVSVTDAYADAADPDLDIVRDDHRLVAGVRRTGECRHHQKRSKKNGKYNGFHDTLFDWGTVVVPVGAGCALGPVNVCIELTSLVFIDWFD